MTAYYNEIDPFAAQWLRNLISAGHIAPGDVDERSITEIKPNELKQYTQCHFFAGIGVWSYALRRSGWRDSRHVWTGSCPCQPFSSAGKGKGADDERHLWPAWETLIRECKPSVVFGEQVASSDVIGKVDGSGECVWLDVVQTHMEDSHYAFGSAVITASGFGAPHIRARTYFVAEHLADADSGECERRPETPRGNFSDRENARRSQSDGVSSACGETNGMEHSNTNGLSQRRETAPTAGHWASTGPASRNGRSDPNHSMWANPDWLGCRYGKFRPVEPGTSPLVDGATQTVGRLRAYGNAICAAQATGFITAYMGNN